MAPNQTYKFIPLASMCCWVRIDHSLKDEEWKWVSMGLMSNHMHHEQARLLGFNGRIRRAWRALRGYLEPELEFTSWNEIADVVNALGSAGTEAFTDHEIEVSSGSA